MRINHNIAALNTYRQLGSANAAQQNSMEKLSSGLRINKAGDDAAGLAISEKMRGQIRGLDMASKNAQDAISMISTAEGGLNETHSILQRMRELSVQASNETLEGDDRTAIGDELKQLGEEVDRIANNTQFNGKNLLNGALTTKIEDTTTLSKGTLVDNAAISKIDVSNAKADVDFTFDVSAATSGKLTINGSDGSEQTIDVSAMATAGDQVLDFDELGIQIHIVAGTEGSEGAQDAEALVGAFTDKLLNTEGNGSATFAIGANANQNITVSFNDMSTGNLGTTGNLGQLVTTVGNNANIVDTSDKAQTLITVIDEAITQVSTERSKFGAVQNRLEHTINNLSTSSENLTAAESRIRDVDMAKEMMEQTKNSILAQASQAMLAQANQQPQGVLQLLR